MGRGFATGCLIALAASVVLVIGVAVVLVVATGNELERRFGDADPAGYVLEVDGCGAVDGRVLPHIVGSITNTSELSRGFRLDVYVFDGDDRVGERDIFIDPLASGQTARLVHPIAVGDAAPEQVRCEVEVSYWGLDG